MSDHVNCWTNCSECNAEIARLTDQIKDIKNKAFWILKSVENWRGPNGKGIGEPLLTCIKTALENFK